MNGNVELAPDHHSYADFSIRYFALILDSIFVGIGIYILSRIGIIGDAVEDLSNMVFWSVFALELPEMHALRTFGPWVLLSKFILLIYKSAFESSVYQATPGKMICKLRVVDYSYSRVGFARSFLRNFGKTISSSVFFAGYWFVLLNRKKQGFHDYLASTYVIRPRPQPLDPLGMKVEDEFV